MKESKGREPVLDGEALVSVTIGGNDGIAEACFGDGAPADTMQYVAVSRSRAGWLSNCGLCQAMKGHPLPFSQ